MGVQGLWKDTAECSKSSHGRRSTRAALRQAFVISGLKPKVFFEVQVIGSLTTKSCTPFRVQKLAPCVTVSPGRDVK
jgi:hypothetical protein